MNSSGGRELRSVEALNRGLRVRLADTLGHEATLLGALCAVFRQQRDALGAGDAERLDDGVFVATRLMRTLEEARLARTGVVRGLVGSELNFAELQEALQGAENREVRVALDQVQEAATELNREIEVFREILHVALDDNRRLLDAWLGDVDGFSPIHPSTAGQERASSELPHRVTPTLLDRRV